ncbi:DUF4365 domain-containing protein [Tenacibaculum sp. MEBiC06402]|uniref:DUF4365 domain-containing protein n=1 Tax=unclassified Tenacibaculum TaxID=2635139 RepID=UPI003B9CCE95
MSKFSPTERIGVSKIETIFLKEFEWIPRTILETDVGIDMTVEIAEKGEPSGELFAIQIKTGESYFSEENNDKIVFRGKEKHLNYWLNYSLPVIIILHNPENDLTIWQEITENNITKTKKSWKIEIPKHQSLSKAFYDRLKNLNRYPKEIQRFQKLLADKKLMRLIAERKDIILEIEDWVNKSDGRVSLAIKENISEDIDNEISTVKYINFYDIKQSLQVVFPWAKFEIDEPFYEIYENDDFMAEYGIWDPEDKQYIGTSIDASEYYSSLPDIRPYENVSGEVEYYRLIFKLNDLGKSILNVIDFADNGKQLKLI